MKATLKAVLAASLLLAPAAFATKVPIPVEGASLNVSVQIQTQFLMNENGSPNGKDPSYDIFVRRTRLLANGDISPNFTYLIQVDNANFGKYGNFTGRAIVQDAWVGWAPLGQTGGNVIYIDAGILLFAVSHHILESTTNYITADTHTDEFRLPNSAFPALRQTGVQLRGWWFDKKVGFRGGAYEGWTPNFQAAGQCTATGAGCATPKRYPMFAGFVNLDIIGSEEGGWLYGAYKWGKDPVLSVSVAGLYQADAFRNTDATGGAVGNPVNARLASASVYLNLPMSEAAELVVEGAGYLNGYGTGNRNTGKGFFLDAGYRFGFVAPYASFSYFQADDCSGLTGTPLTNCNTNTQLGNSRNMKAGLNFFFNKNLNHLNLEFQVNHGVSGYGPTTITAAATSAGYAPAGINTNLRVPAQKSFLAHWNVIF
ncbi:MAG: hypothetical protein ACXWLR_10555 [Myxococcales bacterium]